MRKTVILLPFILTTLVGFSQIKQELLCFNTDPVNTVSHSIFTVSPKNNDVDVDEYGGTFSKGIAFGGGGLVGLPLRVFSGALSALELTIFYRPGIIIQEGAFGNSTTVLNSCVIVGGPNFYLGNQYKSRKEKVILNGISIKGGAGFGDFKTYYFSVNWIHESFRLNSKKNSFTLELGPGYAITEYFDENEDSSNKTLTINIKVQWNWFGV